jgi:hypothetical protein
MKFINIGKLIYISTFLISSLSALEFSIHENNSKTLNAIMATGDIQYDDVEKLDHYLSNLPHKKHTAIYFDSPGGNLAGGIRLGKYFKDRRIKTVVEGYKVCASACAFAFLGGTDKNGKKWMSSTTTSRLGFHAFRNADEKMYEHSDNTQKVVASILAYGKYVNAPTDIFIKSFSTSSDDMYWLTQQEELSLGIKVWDIHNKIFVKNNYLQLPLNHRKPLPETTTYSYNQQTRTDFIKQYFTLLKQVPYSQTWNMLSSSMKRKANLSQYTKWWGRQVKSIILLNTKKLNYNTVQATLKYYMKNGKVICSKDTFTLQKNTQGWLIDNQKSKTISCR